MKPTKARLGNLVVETLRTVLAENERDKSAAVCDFAEEWWLGLDPDFKALEAMYHSEIKCNGDTNKVLELLNSRNVYMYSIRFQSTDTTFEEFRKDFFHNIHKDDIPGIEKLKQGFTEFRWDQEKIYDAIKSNLDQLPVKQGMAYLEELGFDVSVFREEEALPPMIVVEGKDIRFPKKAADEK